MRHFPTRTEYARAVRYARRHIRVEPTGVLRFHDRMIKCYVAALKSFGARDVWDIDCMMAKLKK